MSPLREAFRREMPYADHVWQFTVDKYSRLLGLTEQPLDDAGDHP